MAGRDTCSNVMLERWLLQSCFGILTVARLDVCSVPDDASASASETEALLAAGESIAMGLFRGLGAFA